CVIFAFLLDISLLYVVLLSLASLVILRDLPSFPTRRSSDLIGTEGAARHVSVRGGRLPRGEPGRVPAAQLLPRGVVAAPQRAQPHRSTTQLHQLSSTRHASWSPAATSVTRSGTTASALALDIAFNVGWWAGPNGRAW